MEANIQIADACLFDILDPICKHTLAFLPVLSYGNTRPNFHVSYRRVKFKESSRDSEMDSESIHILYSSKEISVLE